NAAAERAWKAKGWPVPSAQATRAADLWFQRRGAVVVLGPDRSLIEAPLVHKGANTGSAFEARLDVRAIQRALDEAAERGSQGPRRDSLKGLANVAALVTRVDTSAAIRGDEVVTKTTLRVPLSTAAAAPPLIDEWLRSKEIRNSFALPRPLTAEDVRRRIGFVVKSTRREDMQRAFPATPRLSLREEQGRFVLEVSPNGSLRSSPPSSNPVPERAVFVAAREIVGGEPSTAKKVNALVSWVHSQMSYELTSDQYDDLTLLTRKRGDCTEYAQLTVALLNAVDVPARTRTGFVAAGDRLVAHAWVEYHDGQSWTEIDPTMGRTRVDSSYIDASILDVLGLVGAGQLEITAIN
ncbi:MAG TPA: transglutaminase-like domain-containing protein, partial [Polyangia bacterium]